MNNIEDCIRREITNAKSIFVFPTDIVAKQWSRKACAFEGGRTIATSRFLAWDKFKEIAVKDATHGKMPVSGELRLLFVWDLIKRNAEILESQKNISEQPDLFQTEDALPLSAIIPGEYAKKYGTVFASSIAAALPDLAHWEAMLSATKNPLNNVDVDWRIVKKEYGAFLQTVLCYEPSWEKPAIGKSDEQYFIFYPELIEDWNMCRGALNDLRISPIKIDKNNASEGLGILHLYDSSRAELRDVILRIRNLHDDKTNPVPYEDMAISVPDLDRFKPYIMREASLYDVPIHVHSGKALAAYGTGRLFALINECVKSNCTFISLKTLLLNEKLPWKKMRTNKAIISFGIENNCVSGYFQDNVFIDIWEKTLQASGPADLAAYYIKLKRAMYNITKTKTFADLKKWIFDFRKSFLSIPEEKENPIKESPEKKESNDERLEHDMILSRCLEELNNLVLLEKKYPHLTPQKPFDFFIMLLKKKKYVPREKEKGVNLFDYRVAAAAPFCCHFILNASQSASSILYQPLKFLNPDKRKQLGLEDSAAQEDFLHAYKLSAQEGGFYISCAKHTFSGWPIPSSVFSKPEAAAPKTDLFIDEAAFWAKGLRTEKSPFPATLFTTQKTGFETWRKTITASKQFAQAKPDGKTPGAMPAYLQKITKKDGKINVYATALNKYFRCPKIWLYEEVLRLKKPAAEARLLDDDSKGIIYHDILRDFFNNIKYFSKEKIESYKEEIKRLASAYFSNPQNYETALIEPFREPLIQQTGKFLARYLDAEIAYLDEHSVELTEGKITCDLGDVILTGTIDRVSISPDNESVIIDYKTANTPAIASCKANANGNGPNGQPSLEDFQMAMYVKLYENEKQKEVSKALFMNLKMRKPVVIFPKITTTNSFTRVEYQETLDALDIYIDTFQESALAMNFNVDHVNHRECVQCPYQNICRRCFMLNLTEYADE